MPPWSLPVRCWWGPAQSSPAAACPAACAPVVQVEGVWWWWGVGDVRNNRAAPDLTRHHSGLRQSAGCKGRMRRWQQQWGAPLPRGADAGSGRGQPRTNRSWAPPRLCEQARMWHGEGQGWLLPFCGRCHLPHQCPPQSSTHLAPASSTGRQHALQPARPRKGRRLAAPERHRPGCERGRGSGSCCPVRPARPEGDESERQ